MTRKKGMPIPWDWDGINWRCWAIQWPDSPLWKAILMGFVQTPSRGRFWDESTGDLIDVLTIGKEIDTLNDELEECVMSCNEDTQDLLGQMVAALNNIASKIVAGSGCGSCGGGSRGAGTSPAEPIPYDEAETPTTPPPGFADMSEYNAHKCNQAYDIVTNLKNDLQGIAAYNYITADFNDAILFLIAVLLTPIPWDDIATLIGLLIYAGIAYSFLVEMSSEVFDNADDLACVLYVADTPTVAQTEFRIALNGLIQAQSWTTAVKGFVSDACELMTPMDAMNKLFENVPTVSQDRDCSGCEGANIWAINTLICTPTVTSGEFLANEATTVESCQGNYFGTTRAGHNTGAVPTEDLEREVYIDTVTGGGSFYVTARESGVDTNYSMTDAQLLGYTFTCSQLQICRLNASDTTAFTITYVVNLIP